jgi:hypothetical protein
MISTPHILAVDLGKFNSAFCWYEVSSKATTFRTVATSEAEFREALQRQPGVTVVVEACSPAEWVHDLAVSLGQTALVTSSDGPMSVSDIPVSVSDSPMSVGPPPSSE